MKKIISIISVLSAALAFAFVFTACGSKQKKAEKTVKAYITAAFDGRITTYNPAEFGELQENTMPFEETEYYKTFSYFENLLSLRHSLTKDADDQQKLVEERNQMVAEMEQERAKYEETNKFRIEHKFSYVLCNDEEGELDCVFFLDPTLKEVLRIEGGFFGEADFAPERKLPRNAINEKLKNSIDFTYGTKIAVLGSIEEAAFPPFDETPECKALEKKIDKISWTFCWGQAEYDKKERDLKAARAEKEEAEKNYTGTPSYKVTAKLEYPSGSTNVHYFYFTKDFSEVLRIDRQKSSSFWD